VGNKTDRIGAWAEAVAGAHYMKLGWDVFVALNPGAPIDIIITRSGVTRYLDVKYRRNHKPSGRKLSEEQVALGVELVFVKESGDVIETGRKLA
jgi:hypothetical protein